jgi:hypothetical protein
MKQVLVLLGYFTCKRPLRAVITAVQSRQKGEERARSCVLT